MPNPIIRRRIGRTTKYDPLSADYFLRAGITNALEKKWVNYVALQLNANPALKAKLIVLNLCSPTSYGASLHNFISSSFLFSATAAPGFSQTGRTYDGATQFIKTGLTPSTSLGAASNTIGFYSRTNNTSGIQMGAVVSATQELRARPRTATDLAQLVLYTSATMLTGSVTDSSGYFFYSVTGAQARNIRRNNAQVASDIITVVAGTRPNIELYVGARNNAGTADTFSSREEAGVWAASSALTDAECDTLYAILSTYNANVIPGGR
jgi:hypothetical protein